MIAWLALLTGVLVTGGVLCDEENLCSVDKISALVCDICSSKECCSDAQVLYDCFKNTLHTREEEEDNNAISNVDDNHNKIRGKRYSNTGRYSWKPTNYRLLDRLLYDVGFRGKRGMLDRLDWNPPAYRLPASALYRQLADEDVEKRGGFFSPARYDWKPAPYRLDPSWDVSGKRTLWYNRRPTGRYDWKPSVEEKRGISWKPAAYRLRDDNLGLRYMGKRFNLGPGRWNWKPQEEKGRYNGALKRSEDEWEVNEHYVDTRPSTLFNSNPTRENVEKRDRYTQSWKPWKPAAYYMDSQWYG